MSELTYVVPVVGEKNTVAVPKVDSAFTEIKTVVNGKIGGVNLETNAVETEKIKEEAVTGKKLGTETLRMTETAYGARVERTFGTEYEPSATRPVFVVVEIEFSGKDAEFGQTKVEIGGVTVSEVLLRSKEGQSVTSIVSVIVPAGKKWKVPAATNTFKLFSSYLTL